MKRSDSIEALEIDTPEGVIHSVYNFFEDEIRAIIGNVSAKVNESYQAPDAYTCPFCREITLEGKVSESVTISKHQYSPKELMSVIKHEDSCVYKRALELVNRHE